MKNDVRPGVGEGLFHQLKLTDVTDGFIGKRSGREGFVEIGRGMRSEGEAVDLRPEVAEPEAEPSAFKPGVTGDECSFATIKLAEHSLPDLPRRVACGPERLELLLFALGVHTLPETRVTMGLKLAFAGKACQRFTFQNAIIAG